MRDQKLAAALWVRMMKCHGLVLRQVRSFCTEDGITLAQFDALAQLHRHPNGMTPSELSEVLLVTAGNVTGIVARLIERELVSSEVLDSDRRVRVLRLTASGRCLASQSVRRHEKLLEDIFEDFPRDERLRLVDSLEHLRHTLERN